MSRSLKTLGQTTCCCAHWILQEPDNILPAEVAYRSLVEGVAFGMFTDDRMGVFAWVLDKRLSHAPADLAFLTNNMGYRVFGETDKAYLLSVKRDTHNTAFVKLLKGVPKT